jgi:hypothetical protein
MTCQVQLVKCSGFVTPRDMRVVLQTECGHRTAAMQVQAGPPHTLDAYWSSHVALQTRDAVRFHCC